MYIDKKKEYWVHPANLLPFAHARFIDISGILLTNYSETETTDT